MSMAEYTWTSLCHSTQMYLINQAYIIFHRSLRVKKSQFHILRSLFISIKINCAPFEFEHISKMRGNGKSRRNNAGKVPRPQPVPATTPDADSDKLDLQTPKSTPAPIPIPRTVVPTLTPVPADMASPTTVNTCRRLLICSIGNPSPYEGTRHSAGHIFLHKLPSLLHPTNPHGSLSKSSTYKGLLLTHPTFTLFQSPTYMNTSGPAISHAWKTFLKQSCPTNYDRDRAHLVILHDELDKDGGKIKLKRGGSAGGHNGIESIAQSLGTKDFLRLGIGIGRPKGIGKDPKAVADYVLSPFNEYELKVLEERSLPMVVDALIRLSKEP
ncbi:peptidyl-tRNA hydrolase [Peziza echinospora]|nr:peptidyl-tRNA hydrolase [Peziza echinospora]